MQKDVLVIGGGVAGLQAALELAGAGYPVHLITDEASLGGKLVGPQKEDMPCIWGKQVNISALYLGGNLHASGTVLGSLITRAMNAPLINIIPNAKLIEFKGEVGSFTAGIADVATNQKIKDLNVGAVILATGFSMYDAAKKGELGYSYHKNVLTSLEYENLLTQNRYKSDKIKRPSDGKNAKKIAFIQCVGSRDLVSKGEYCSAICCMFTAKEAILTKEFAPESDVTVFYLDIRSCGKNFDTFYNRARELGTRYVRTMISEVKEDPVTENLIINYAAASKPVKEEFDLVVLAAGIRPHERLAETAGILQIPLNEFGFVAVDKLNPVATKREGIFSVGGNQGPLDVPETMALSSAASASVVKSIGKSERPHQKPAPEKNVSSEKPNIGVFFCQAGLAAMGANADKIVEAVKNQPYVFYVGTAKMACSPDALKGMKETVTKKSLNRIVVAPCVLKHNLHLFQDAAQNGGLNRMLVEMAAVPNVNWEENKDKADKEAIAITKKAIANVKAYQPLNWHAEPVINKALVVGGGITGMAAALSLADRGFASVLIEREEELGGYAAQLKGTPENDAVKATVEDMVRQVSKNDKIQVFTNAQLTAFSGRQGNFAATVAIKGKGEQKIEHGVVILATGTVGSKPQEYFYGEDKRVVTGVEALRLLSAGELPLNKRGSAYVFIQCVGSRNESTNYCSQSCCAESVESAARIKERDPDANVYVLSRDIRMPGYLELKYKKARQLGVVFIHYEEKSQPELVKAETGLSLNITDSASGKKLSLKPDCVILAAAQKAAPDSKELADLLKIQINQDGFLSETHANFGTIAFPGGGIFIAGASHGPKGITECLVQAKGVAGRAARILSQPVLMMGGIVAEVEWEKCAACLTCVRTCPYTIPEITREKKEMGAAYIPPANCRGCGMCASECPNKAIFLHHYQDSEVIARVERALTEVG
ncbi:MAG: FAD-dependent oxidoreductase [Sporomusaceae bacterium]|jgi:heterodisulfide reductase subunit A|nr:FAD-dependent oxidoreductase [Sporomusaceae bacterium]